MDRKIVCIGLDGATWNLLRPWMDAGKLPQIKRLVESGVSGDLESILPPETPAAWPSFMTGKNPGKHGVFDFLVYDPENKIERPVNSRRRVGKAIWDYLDEAGKTSVVLNVPTTYPVSPIKGAMISGFLTPGDARDYAHPPELVEEFEREYGRYPLFFETMAFVCAHSEQNAAMFLDELEFMDRTKFEVCEKLFDRHQPDFTMLHIWGTDRLQHELWNWIDETHPAYDRAMAEKFMPRIEAYYSMCDAYIGRLVEKAGPEAITFVISDHGFGPTHHFIDLNSWLLQEGFITLKSSPRVRFKKLLWDLGFTPQNITRLCYPFLRFAAKLKARPPEATLRKSSGTIKLPLMLNLNDDVDWSRTQAYAPFGWSGIYINSVNVRPHGSVAAEDYDSVRDAILERYQYLVNPHNGEHVGGPVHIKKDIYEGPFTPYGPDIMPLPLDQHYMPVCFFGFQSKAPVYKNNTLYGNHQMNGILIANGPGLQSGELQGAKLIDLAPTLLHLLGQPVPEDMDGRVLLELLTPEARATRPVTMLQTGDASEEPGDALSDEEEAELRDRLAGLGYL